MALVVNTNVSSLTAQRNLVSTNRSLTRSIQRLSSGLRINSAKDDAAGLAISDRMNSQIRGLNQAVRNANDGISMAQTAEGALQESTNILQRIRELAVQAANDSNTGADRASIQKEVSQLQAELNRIANTTAFNGQNLLDGTFGSAKIHVGAEASQNISVSMGDVRATSIGYYRVTTEYYASGISSANSGASNDVGAGSISVNGYLGNKSVSYSAGATAKDIAKAVNDVQGETGVTAKAATYAKISGITSGTTVMFNLTGQNTSESVTVSASLTSATDLTELAKAINDVQGKTGITATLSSDKKAILLENKEGYDMKFSGVSGTGTFHVVGLKHPDDFTSTQTWTDSGVQVGSAISVDDGDYNQRTATVGGTVVFGSVKSYTVTANANDDGLFDDTDAHSGSLNGSATNAPGNDVGSIDVSTQTGANHALDIVDGALSYIDDLRADLGAIQNRFDSTISNLMNVSENLSAAKSRIMDADFAQETANMTRAQILQQSGTAMLAQANTLPQAALTLLQ